MKKNIASFLLAAVLCLSFVPTAFAAADIGNFKKNADYVPGQFVDVAENDWYAQSVKTAYEWGLVKGNDESHFNPTGNITIAETITLAARLHSIYMDDHAEFTQTSVWYQVYVNYAIGNDIITENQFNDYNAIATRTQFAEILYASLPSKEFYKLNRVKEIPDVDVSEPYFSTVLSLYNAGILTGSDSYGTFNPNSNIQRSEVAAIVTRIANPAMRVAFSLSKKPLVISDMELVGKTSLVTGESTAWTAKALPEGASSAFSWTSGNPDVATVDQSGKITAHSPGKADITVTGENNIQKTVSVTVSQKLSVSAPHSNDTLFLDGYALGFYLNSVNEIYVGWLADNTSGKRINYYTTYYRMYNPVGDPAYDQITGLDTFSIRTVGPIDPGETLIDYCGTHAYSNLCSKIVLEKIELEYADGTTETVNYGYSGEKTLWDQYYNNFYR